MISHVLTELKVFSINTVQAIRNMTNFPCKKFIRTSISEKFLHKFTREHYVHF